MGTTQRISPGVPGEPNWGSLNNSITQIAKTVEKEKSEEENANGKKPEQLAASYQRIIGRRNYHLNAAFRNLVNTGGGRKNISSGKSKSIGRAGLRSTQKLASFFSSTGSQGLQSALQQIGFGDLTGKTVSDVVDFLLVYCSDTNTGMDETAANKATCELLNEIEIQSGNDLDKCETLLKEYVEGNGLADLLCMFWGHYIFEHLSQRFQEKITQQRGDNISSETFDIIKDDIMGRVKVLNSQRPIEKINWKGREGSNHIESIFDSIIKIIYEDEN